MERSSEKTTEEGRNSITIDLGKLYRSRAEDIFPEITATAYSNLAYVNCTGRDVFIDFLEMPGVKCPDGTVRLRGTRVYMSHAAAERMGKVLTEILEKTYTRGGMEEYPGVRKPGAVPATVPKRRGRKKKEV